ncbi:MAG: hypothetical protein HUU10_10970 [Bacteroidetes bacterium]|nr:hypothetical protein [Bacteroidota bacterium]
MSFLHLLPGVLAALLISQLLYAHEPDPPGSPAIRVVPPSEYQAHNQNWSISASPDGLVAAGNNSGLLIFNGNSWSLIPMPSQKVVRSVAVLQDGIFFAGLKGDFGIVDLRNSQAPSFSSLTSHLPAGFPAFSNIWETWVTGEGVFFLADHHLFRWSDSALTVIKSDRGFLTSRAIGKDFYIQVKDSGLFRYQNGRLQSGSDLPSLPGELQFVLLRRGDGSWVTGDRQTGLVFRNGSGVIPFPEPVRTWSLTGNLYCGIQLPDGRFVFGSSKSGLVITGSDGTLLHHFDQSNGLPDPAVRAVTWSPDGRLWVATNNGLAAIDLGNGVISLSGKDGLNGTVNDVVRGKTDWWAATSQGVYRIDIKPRLSRGEPKAKLVPGLDVQAWSVIESHAGILAGNYTGVWLVSGQTPERILKGTTYTLFRLKTDRQILVAGQEDQVVFLRDVPGYPVIQTLKTPGEILQLDQDRKGDLWAGTNNSMALRFNKTGTGLWSFSVIDTSAGHPTGWSTPFSAGGRIVFGTRQGLLSPGPDHLRLITDPVLETGFKRTASDVFRLVSLGDSVYYARSGSKLYRYRLADKTWKQDAAGGIPQFQVYWLDADKDHLYVGGTAGLFSIKRIPDAGRPLLNRAVISRIEFGQDSVFFSGPAWYTLPDQTEPVIPDRLLGIRFSFSGTSQISDQPSVYRTRLSGFDENWSAWTSENRKEFTNLSPGRYTFSLVARNGAGLVSDTVSFSFRVATPWYLTWWALALIFLLASSLVYGLLMMILRSFKARNRQLEAMVAIRTTELKERNEELERLNGIIRAINSEWRFDDLIQTILDHLSAIPGVEKSSVLVFNPHTNLFEFRAAHGWDLEDLRTVTLTESEAWSRYVSTGTEVFQDIFSFTSVTELPVNEKFRGLELPKSLVVLRIPASQYTAAYIILDNMSQAEAFLERDLSMLRNLKSNIQYAFAKASMLEEKSLLLSESQRKNNQILEQSREIRKQKDHLEEVNQQLNQTLSEMSAMQMQLIQSEKMASLGTLVAGIAHEINNPVNYINASIHPLKDDISELKSVIRQIRELLAASGGNGESDLLERLKTVAGQADLQDICDEIDTLLRGVETGSKRTADIVRSLRSFSRRDSGGFKPADIHEGLEATLMLCRSEARDKIVMERRYSPLPEVPCHAGQINQVFMNIVVNAMDAMLPAGGTLTITTGLDGDQVFIDFTDTGTGIPEPVMKHIFDPFFTTKPVGKGTGLGLAISYGIIQAHHGTITVTSEEGKGTTFRILLPLEQPEAKQVTGG